jgi:DNA-binding MarR family transcriptional regulator
MPRWLSDDEQRAWRAFLQMSARLDATLNRELQQTSGLSLADYEVLVLLSEAPDGRLRIYRLADDLQWEQSRLSHHLARMQRRGLVTREECTTDRRGAFVVLTPAGRTAIEQAAPAHVGAVRRLVFDGLTPDQVGALESVARLVITRLEDDDQGRGADVVAGASRSSVAAQLASRSRASRVGEPGSAV